MFFFLDNRGPEKCELRRVTICDFGKFVKTQWFSTSYITMYIFHRFALSYENVWQNRHSEFCAPLTSLDWNESDPTMVGTSSIDTTCTIWDITKEEPKQQLIAHDSDVYDIAFAKGVFVFASVGADGSVRMFDLR